MDALVVIVVAMVIVQFSFYGHKSEWSYKEGRELYLREENEDFASLYERVAICWCEEKEPLPQES